ncbi:MAG: hypothetical protein C4617_03540 [Candidatus Liberibacter europaeus]|uniref:Energy transducer TonB n=1 Tax=Candidatus Liberibacter europaeus TaxID=744859 RepID=A0A2T4VXI1_9HYPH|nr:hypothetical protein [Candidatus Liberibacter europaeus]PTL86480.1 MAG: hypothetical protein C4617_03540 [Candidatus Liberibacter europaeus]
MHTENGFAISLVLHVVLLVLLYANVSFKLLISHSNLDLLPIEFIKDSLGDGVNKKEYATLLRESGEYDSSSAGNKHSDQKREEKKYSPSIETKKQVVSDKSNYPHRDSSVSKEDYSSNAISSVVRHVGKKHNIADKHQKNDVHVKSHIGQKANNNSSVRKMVVDRVLIRKNGKLPVSESKVANKHGIQSIHQNYAYIAIKKIAKNWNIPSDLKKLRKVQIKVDFRLKRDGSVFGKPDIKVVGGNSMISKILVDHALRAIMKSQPFHFPSNKYEKWRNMKLNFVPSKM